MPLGVASVLLLPCFLQQPPVWRRVARAQPSPIIAMEAPADGTKPSWNDEEDWAILDAAPDFSVGVGTNSVSTFWTALAASSAVLCQRSAAECEQRAAELAERQNMTLSIGPEPRVLDAWEKLPDGRITGRLDGRTIWLTVALEGRLPSDPRSGPGYIEALGGAVYELGAPATADAARETAPAVAAGSSAAIGDEWQRWGVLKGVVRSLQLSPQAEAAVPVLMSFALVGGLGYLVGSQAEVGALLGQGAAPATMASAKTLAPSPPSPPPLVSLPGARTYPSAERVSLTVSEQRARQQCVACAVERGHPPHLHAAPTACACDLTLPTG